MRTVKDADADLEYYTEPKIMEGLTYGFDASWSDAEKTSWLIANRDWALRILTRLKGFGKTSWINYLAHYNLREVTILEMIETPDVATVTDVLIKTGVGE